MVSDILNSFKDNVSQKATNPFLATILIVWTFKNWRLLYALLYFDEKTTLEARLAFIESYYSNENFFYTNLFESIGYAFVVLIGTYILLAIARIIVDAYNRVILPWISRWTDKNSIVLKEKYKLLFSQCEELESKLEDEKAAKAKIKKELESVEAKNIELMTSNKAFMAKEAKYKDAEENLEILLERQKQLESELKVLQNLKKENTELKGRLTNSMLENQKLSMPWIEFEGTGNESRESSYELELIKKLESDNAVEHFVKVGEKILNNEHILKSDLHTRELVSLELIKYKKEFIQGISAFYEFSPIGKRIYNHFIKRQAVTHK